MNYTVIKINSTELLVWAGVEMRGSSDQLFSKFIKGLQN